MLDHTHSGSRVAHFKDGQFKLADNSELITINITEKGDTIPADPELRFFSTQL